MGFITSKGQYHAFHATLALSLLGFREADASGDVGNAVANGGVLASDTTPILRGAAGGISQEISWATGNVDKLVHEAPLPADFDPDEDVLVDLEVYSGTTDAATFTVATSWNGGATVTDTATDSSKSATRHVITARISAADIPAGATSVTLLLTPAAHATNTIQLCGARLRYAPKTH